MTSGDVLHEAKEATRKSTQLYRDVEYKHRTPLLDAEKEGVFVDLAKHSALLRIEIGKIRESRQQYLDQVKTWDQYLETAGHVLDKIEKEQEVFLPK